MSSCASFSVYNFSTVDRENFAVKIISQSRPTAKIKHAKNKITMISEQAYAQVHTPQGKCPTDDYSEQSLALLIPGS